MKTDKSRREILRNMTMAVLAGPGGLWLGGCSNAVGRSECALDLPEPTNEAARPVQKEPAGPTYAVSLAALAAAVERRPAKGNSGQVPSIPKTTRFSGFLTDEQGDLVLFGTADPAVPEIELDCLVVALRSAYQVSQQYHDVPGCTIDPRPGDDPWSIQQVRVFGMPPSCSMAVRQVGLDYELKKIGAGVVREPGIRSAFDIGSEAGVCGEKAQTARSTVHRYWFYPLVPAAPRSERDEGILRILTPIGVQLLTEREFLDRQGRRTGAAEASAEALAFAKDVTSVLAQERVRRYARLTADFRVVELAKLIRYEKVAEGRLQYFLEDHRLESLETPRFVGGIIRRESGEIVCDAPVVERTQEIECRRRAVSYRTEYRGGVEVKIEVEPEDFRRQPSKGLLAIRAAILASRPAADSVVWPAAGVGAAGA